MKSSHTEVVEAAVAAGATGPEALHEAPRMGSESLSCEPARSARVTQPNVGSALSLTGEALNFLSEAGSSDMAAETLARAT